MATRYDTSREAWINSGASGVLSYEQYVKNAQTNSTPKPKAEPQSVVNSAGQVVGSSYALSSRNPWDSEFKPSQYALDHGIEINPQTGKSLNPQASTTATQTSPAPSVPQPSQSYQPTQSQPSLAPINFDQYRTTSTTIDELAQKYGFDYSRGYAENQASLEAQAARNALEDVRRRNEALQQQNLQGIDSSVMNATEALDRDYFQQMLAQQQGQALSGIAGGIAGDQDVRLQMNRQAQMAPIYRDAQLGQMQERDRYTNDELRLLEALGLVDQEELVRADQLYNDRRQQGFQNTIALDSLRQNENLSMLMAELQQRGQNINMDQFDRGLELDWSRFGLDQDKFDWSKILDEATLTGQYDGQDTWAKQQQDWQNRFQYGAEIGQFANGQTTIAGRRGALEELLSQIEATGQLPAEWGGGLSVQEQERQSRDQLAWAMHNAPYEQLTAYQKAQLDQNASQFNAQQALNREQWQAQQQGQQGMGGSLGSLSGTQLNATLDMYRQYPELRPILEMQYPELRGMMGGQGGLNPNEAEFFIQQALADESLDLLNADEQKIRAYVGGLQWQYGWTSEEGEEMVRRLQNRKGQLLNTNNQNSGGGFMDNLVNNIPFSPNNVTPPQWFQDSYNWASDIFGNVSNAVTESAKSTAQASPDIVSSILDILLPGRGKIQPSFPRLKR